MKYEVIGYQRYTGYDKVYFDVDATSPEEALRLVKENPDNYYVDSKGIDSGDYEYIDEDEWEILE